MDCAGLMRAQILGVKWTQPFPLLVGRTAVLVPATGALAASTASQLAAVPQILEAFAEAQSIPRLCRSFAEAKESHYRPSQMILTTSSLLHS